MPSSLTSSDSEEPASHRVELQEDGNSADPAPFKFTPYELAHMLDPKSTDTLRSFGGTSGLLNGLGTTKERGLSTGRGGKQSNGGAVGDESFTAHLQTPHPAAGDSTSSGSATGLRESPKENEVKKERTSMSWFKRKLGRRE